MMGCDDCGIRGVLLAQCGCGRRVCSLCVGHHADRTHAADASDPDAFHLARQSGPREQARASGPRAPYGGGRASGDARAASASTGE
jgi:hypothetical protein